MDGAQVADTFGVMAVLAIAGIAVAAIASVTSPSGRALVRDLVDEHGRLSAWLVAVVATGGSLWFSEVADFTPCELCWYQRIAMYPLVIVLGVRALRPGGSPDLRLAGLLLVGAGLLVNAWHVTIETWPSLDSGSCDPVVPCTLRWVEGLGFFTIPRLATVAFALVGLALLADRSDSTGDPYARPDDADDLDAPVLEEEPA